MIPFALVCLLGSAVALVLLSPLGLPFAALAAPILGSAIGVAVTAVRMG